MNFADFDSIFPDLRDFTGDEWSFKDQRRNDSDDTTKCAYLISKNKSFARPSRTCFISVHFFLVLGKSAT